MESEISIGLLFTDSCIGWDVAALPETACFFAEETDSISSLEKVMHILSTMSIFFEKIWLDRNSSAFGFPVTEFAHSKSQPVLESFDRFSKRPP